MAISELISITDYKKVAGLSATNIEVDFTLSTFITSVSQLVKTYCNNTFLDHYDTTGNGRDGAKVETFNPPYAVQVLQLSENPVIVTSGKPIVVKERSSLTDSYTTLVNNQDYYVDTHTDSIYRVPGTIFKDGPGAVEITYYAGYESVPADLKLAVIDLITYYFRGEHKPRQTIAGASRQQNPTTSLRDNVDFPDHIKRILDMYKNY